MQLMYRVTASLVAIGVSVLSEGLECFGGQVSTRCPKKWCDVSCAIIITPHHFLDILYLFLSVFSVDCMRFFVLIFLMLTARVLSSHDE